MKLRGSITKITHKILNLQLKSLTSVDWTQFPCPDQGSPFLPGMEESNIGHKAEMISFNIDDVPN